MILTLLTMAAVKASLPSPLFIWRSSGFAIAVQGEWRASNDKPPVRRRTVH